MVMERWNNGISFKHRFVSVKPPRGKPRDILAKANKALMEKSMKYIQVIIACTILSAQNLNAGGMADAVKESGIKGGIVVHLDCEEHVIPKELLNETVEAYPVLEGMKILCVKRAMPEVGKKGPSITMLKSLGFPSNHECQSSVDKMNFNNEIGIL